MKKIAFLFLTRKNHNCELIWNLFFRDVNKDLYSIYNHYKVKPTQNFLSKNTISNIIPTQWADISLVKASILLFRQAFLDKENHFFILLSESCIPISDFFSLRNFLVRNNTSIIHYKHLKNKFSRYQKLHNFIKSRLEFKNFYCQHQWMILTRQHVKLILHYNLLDYFRYTDVPDEHYFICLFVLLKKNKEILNKKTTFCNWDNCIMHPKTYNKVNNKIIINLRQQGFFFMRKISENFLVEDFLKKTVRSKNKK